MELHAMVEMLEGLAGNLSPRDLTGFGVALTFLFVFRGLAWAFGRKKTNTKLATSILSALETASPESVQKTKDGYQYGTVAFDERGNVSVNGRSVKGHLTRGERRQVRRQIGGLVARQKVYDNDKLAQVVAQSLAAPAVQSFATAPVARLAPAVRVPTDAELVAGCFGVNYDKRTLAGIVKATGLSQDRVLRVLRTGYKVNSKGFYSVA
jgi:hypothetical protein